MMSSTKEAFHVSRLLLQCCGLIHPQRLADFRGWGWVACNAKNCSELANDGFEMHIITTAIFITDVVVDTAFF